MSSIDAIRLDLPGWTAGIDRERRYASDGDKMALAIELSRQNVEAGTGGPFGAAVFVADDRLVSVGVNRVEACRCSAA